MAPPGATQDLLLVAMVPVMRELAGIDLAIDNANGEDGVRAARLVAADPADGAHLGMTHGFTLSWYPQVGDVGFAPDALEPLVGIGGYNWVLIAAAGGPATIDAALDRCLAEGRPLRYVGVGEVDRMMVSAIARRRGVAVEFTGANGPALLERLTSGLADVGMGTGTHQPLLANGTVRELVRLHPRDVGTPGIPNLPALGIDVHVDNFVVIFAPRGLPAATKAELVEKLRRTAADPRVAGLVTGRLMMSPGFVAGAELAAALDAQRQGLARLRAIATP